MCHLSMNLSDTFDQNPPCTVDKTGETYFDEKRSHGLTLRATVKVKGQGHSKNQKTIPQGAINMPLQKYLSSGSLSNWCDPEEDADISKTINLQSPTCHTSSHTLYYLQSILQL